VKKYLSILIIFLCVKAGFSQELPRYNHYFNYSNLYNPAFLSEAESTELNLLYRKQWIGLDGAPEFMHAGIQIPFSKNVAVGIVGSHLEQGILMNSSAMGTFAYTAQLSNATYLSFGLAAGTERTAVDIDQIQNFSDPALAGALDKSFYMVGQAGILLAIKNLKIAASLPSLFEGSTFSSEDFQEISFEPLNSTLTSISYKFQLSHRFSLEPMGMYRIDKNLPDQWQAYATLYYDDLLWLGGNYSDDYGAAGHAGLRINDKISLSYSFDFANNELSSYDSHEVFISITLGRNKINRAPKTYVTETTPIPEAPPEAAPEAAPKNITKPVQVDTPKEDVEEVEPIIEEEVADIKETTESLKKEQEVEEVPDKPEVRDSVSAPITIDGMKPGYYVVVGAFLYEKNALEHIDNISQTTSLEAEIAFNTRTQYHYVYLLHSQSREDAVNLRDRIRQVEFSESWILIVE